jgi:hypothetical protein
LAHAGLFQQGVGLSVGRQHAQDGADDPRVPESMPHVIAPFLIPIADQDVRVAPAITSELIFGRTVSGEVRDLDR